MAQMATRWAQVERTLSDKVLALAEQLAQMQKAGEVISASKLWELDRARTLLKQVEAEMGKYADDAAQLITNEQRARLDLALRHSQQAIQLSYWPGVAAKFDKLPVRQIENMAGLAGNGQPIGKLLRLRMVRDVDGNPLPEVFDRLTRTLINSTAQGINPRQTAKAMAADIAQGRKKAEVIARTEQLRVYRMASRQQYEESGVVSGYRRMAAHDDRTCLGCLAAEGDLYTVEQELDDHPSGRCHPGHVLTYGPSPVAATTRYYKGDIVRIRTSSGIELSFTPNHPVLTLRGWVAGGLLNKGDYVISGSLCEDAAATIDKYDYHMPTKIEEIAESFGVVLREMPATAKDFHGDGEGSDVYVIRANSLLGDDLQATGFQHVDQHQFCGRNVACSGLSGSRIIAAMLEGLLFAASPFLCNGNPAEMFFSGRSRGQKAIGGSLVSELNASLEQIASYDRTRDAEMSGNAILGLTRQIQLSDFINREIVPSGVTTRAERIIDIDRSYLTDHVYSLQTQNGWYIAHDNTAQHGRGIITHNCTLVPIVPGHEVQFQTGEDWLNGLPEERQRTIMGRYFEGYQNGDFKFSQLATHTHDETWGGGIAVTPLDQLSIRRAA